MVAVEGCGCGRRCDRAAVFRGRRNRSPSGLRFSPRAGGPVESVLRGPDRCGTRARRVPRAVPSCPRLRVQLLRGDVGAADLDHGQLVAPDAPRRGPPPPAAVSKRQPSRPSRAERERATTSWPTTSTSAVRSIVDELPPFGGGNDEHLAVAAGRRRDRRNRRAASRRGRRSPSSSSRSPALTASTSACAASSGRRKRSWSWMRATGTRRSAREQRPRSTSEQMCAITGYASADASPHRRLPPLRELLRLL